MGKLPDGWRLVELSELASVERGKFSARPRNDPRYYDGRIPFVQTGDIRGADTWLTRYSQTLNDEGLSVSRLFPSGTILMTIAANIGDVSITAIDVACPDSIVAIQPFGNVDTIWLLYALKTHKTHLEYIASQNAQKNINLQVLKPLTIIVPPLAEQRKIAQILSTWDEAIALVETLIAALKHRKQGLMQRLLTGEVRFPGFDDEWQEVRLGDVFAERNEKGFDHLPLVAITREEGIIWRDELDRRDTSSEDKSNYLRIYPGDIGYNTMRMWQGVSGVSNIEGIVSPAYTICVPNENTDPHFMGYLFKLPAIIHTFWRYSQGLVKDTLALKFNNFAQISLHVPPTKQEQSEIAGFLREVDEHMSHLSNYKECLQDEKRGLMQRLLTGEVRVHV